MSHSVTLGDPSLSVSPSVFFTHVLGAFSAICFSSSHQAILGAGGAGGEGHNHPGCRSLKMISGSIKLSWGWGGFDGAPNLASSWLLRAAWFTFGADGKRSDIIGHRKFSRVMAIVHSNRVLAHPSFDSLKTIAEEIALPLL